MNHYFRFFTMLALMIPSSLFHAQTMCVDSSLINPNAICITLYDPVCGCNGVTYGNTCEAINYGGVSSWTTGPCAAGNCNTLQVSFEYFPVSDATYVAFSDQSNMLNGQIVAWAWDFGDGETSLEQNPGHVFASSGSYIVCLTVKATDANGLLCEKTFCQTIIVPDDCIDPCFYGFDYVLEGTSLHAQFDIVDPPFFFYVDWSLDEGSATGSGLDFVHLFNQPGIHTLCATYPTGDFSAETCTVCRAIEVKDLCVDSNQIDLSVPCPLAFIPVCGCDGVTYDNACTAFNYGGVSSWAPGVCGSVCNNLFIDFQGANTGSSPTYWSFLDQSIFQGGAVSSWYWDFGNGQTSTDENPDIDFLAPGEYEVCLTVSGLFADGTQCGGSVCKKIVVAGALCVDPSIIDFDILCNAVYDPVCGCEGHTYANACVAKYYNGITSWTPGVCPDQCANPLWVDSTVACIEIYDPVCGCDGSTYDNACYAIHYGGINAWTKGVCCENPACKALFSVTAVSGSSVMIKNLSTSAEASALDFGDGTPLSFGVFDTLLHTYASPGIYQICLEISNFSGSCTDTYCQLVNLTSAVTEPKMTQVQVEIAPNPAREQALVRVIGGKAQQACLYDILGKKVWSKVLSESSFTIETIDFPAGAYFLQVLTANGGCLKQMLKMD